MSLCPLCFFIAFSFFSFVQTVPPDYCLSPLNRSDCHKEPTPVFSYYKPGSRCEIQTWRGCPTLNKFENEYVCSLNCLFRVMRQHESEEEEFDLVVIDECGHKFNGDKCSNQTETVYTHINGTCVETTWRGCATYNKFADKATCDTTCKTVVEEVQQKPIEEKLKELDETPLEEINEILKDIIEEEFTTEPPTTTTEAESEPESESHSEPESSEETTTPEPTEPTTNDDYEEVIHAM